MNNSQAILLLISRLMGFALFLQTIEFLKIKESFTEKGIWRWSEIRSEHSYMPKGTLRLLDWLMGDQPFINMLSIRLTCSFLLIIFPNWAIFQTVFCILLFFISFLLTIRFRGSFNGGSDYLGLIIILCLSIGFMHPTLSKGALWYISLQVMSSYFLAGLVKIKQKKWREGTALYGFISSPSYQAPLSLIRMLSKQSTAFYISWGLMLFELSFPLVLMGPTFTWIYLTCGFLFHFINFFLFGLNRFFFIWVASYPAIYYCSQYIYY